jgi:hypothetical protein
VPSPIFLSSYQNLSTLAIVRVSSLNFIADLLY